MDKYEVLEQIGEGAYGFVCKAKEKATGEIVAIKTFKDSSEQDATIQNRELQAAISVSSAHVVECIEGFHSHGSWTLIFEFINGKNLQQHLNNHPNGLPRDTVRRLIHELCEAVRACHRAKVIHRDIKPENCMLDKGDTLKLCDFGVARVIDMPGVALSNYVATRWYRPPELELRSNQYSFSADIWSIGCILVEAACGYPLFPGETSIDQIHLIETMLGPLPPIPGAKVVKKLGEQGAGRRAPKDQMQGMQQLPDGESAVTANGSASSGAVDATAKLKEKYGYWLGADGLSFLEGCIRLNPTERLTAEELLKHPYLAKQSNKADVKKTQKDDDAFMEEELEGIEEESLSEQNLATQFSPPAPLPKAAVSTKKEAPQTKPVRAQAKSASEPAEDDYYSDCFEDCPPSPCASPEPRRELKVKIPARQGAGSGMSDLSASEVAAYGGRGGKSSPYQDARPAAMVVQKAGGRGGKGRGSGGRRQGGSPTHSTGSGSTASGASGGSIEKGGKGKPADEADRNHRRSKADKSKKGMNTKERSSFGDCIKFSDADADASHSALSGKSGVGSVKSGKEGRVAKKKK